MSNKPLIKDELLSSSLREKISDAIIETRESASLENYESKTFTSEDKAEREQKKMRAWRTFADSFDVVITQLSSPMSISSRSLFARNNEAGRLQQSTLNPAFACVGMHPLNQAPRYLPPTRIESWITELKETEESQLEVHLTTYKPFDLEGKTRSLANRSIDLRRAGTMSLSRIDDLWPTWFFDGILSGSSLQNRNCPIVAIFWEENGSYTSCYRELLDSIQKDLFLRLDRVPALVESWKHFIHYDVLSQYHTEGNKETLLNWLDCNSDSCEYIGELKAEIEIDRQIVQADALMANISQPPTLVTEQGTKNTGKGRQTGEKITANEKRSIYFAGWLHGSNLEEDNYFNNQTQKQLWDLLNLKNPELFAPKSPKTLEAFFGKYTQVSFKTGRPKTP